MGFGKIKPFFRELAHHRKLEINKFQGSYYDRFDHLFIYVDVIALTHCHIRNSTCNQNVEHVVKNSFEKFVYLFQNLLMLSAKNISY